MSLPLHNPPGFVNDLTAENKKLWSEAVRGFMLTENVSPEMTPQFYDSTLETEEEVQTATVKWVGFPKQIKLKHPSDEQRWKAADSDRNFQDEYLEWQYFEFLAEKQRETLIELYLKLNPGVAIQATDLFHPDGSYNPTNKWNSSSTTGTIMHLIQRNNTLGAEVDLAARATVVRKRQDGTIITDEQELIRCSKYGNANRNSDPAIGIACNNQVRQQPRKLTVDDPVGLYINSVNWGSVEPPAGHEEDEPRDFWKWTRGSKDHYMRAEFEVPVERGYVVGDLLVNGQPLKYGAQLADYIYISITARTSKWDDTMDPRLCSEAPPPKVTTRSAANTATTEAGTQKVLQEVPGLTKYASVRD